MVYVPQRWYMVYVPQQLGLAAAKSTKHLVSRFMITESQLIAMNYIFKIETRCKQRTVGTSCGASILVTTIRMGLGQEASFKGART